MHFSGLYDRVKENRARARSFAGEAALQYGKGGMIPLLGGREQGPRALSP